MKTLISTECSKCGGGTNQSHPCICASNIRPDMLTNSGHYFNFLTPDPDVINIRDIALALSRICRFGGHSNYFYSVVQHSVEVSKLVPPEYAMQALLHDAAEAYLGDMVGPLKQLIPQYKEIEHRVEQVIWKKFGLPAELHESVKHADLVMLATEQHWVMPDHDDNWTILEGIEKSEGPFYVLSIEEARRYFLDRFHILAAL